MEEKKKKSKKITIHMITIIINIIASIIIFTLGIIFISQSIDKSEIGVAKNIYGGKTISLGYATTYGADFYTEMSLNTKYIANATKETYYLIEKCFGILLIIIGVFNILHNLKQLENKRTPRQSLFCIS